MASKTAEYLESHLKTNKSGEKLSFKNVVNILHPNQITLRIRPQTKLPHSFLDVIEGMKKPVKP